MNKAVFLDLNGTLVLPVQAQSPEEYQAITGSIEAVRVLNQAGFICPVVTVQTRIEKGYFTETAFRDWFATFAQICSTQNAFFSGLYLCPHSAKTNCACYKPQPKLYLDAAHDHNIDYSQSYVVGDTLGDIQAGASIGAKSCFVKTGWANRYLPQHADEAAFVGADLLAVARWIIADSAR